MNSDDFGHQDAICPSVRLIEDRYSEVAKFAIRAHEGDQKNQGQTDESLPQVGNQDFLTDIRCGDPSLDALPRGSARKRARCPERRGRAQGPKLVLRALNQPVSVCSTLTRRQSSPGLLTYSDYPTQCHASAYESVGSMYLFPTPTTLPSHHPFLRTSSFCATRRISVVAFVDPPPP